MTWYHYSKGIWLESILRDGFLKGTSSHPDKIDVPAVWATDQENFPGCCHVLDIVRGMSTQRSLDESREIYRGLVRFVLLESSVPFTWRSWRQQSGIGSSMSKQLEQVAICKWKLSVDRWRCSLKAIPQSDWIRVEIDRGQGWKTVQR